jgi:hypothetical protein
MNKTVHKILIISYFTAGVAVLLLLGVNGYEYYTTPVEERFFNPSHTSLKPSGVLGHGFGIVGTLMMLSGVTIYMLRKRWKYFNWGYLKHWLEFHIFLCSVGPLLVLYHTSFKFGGIVSVSFWSMVAVVLSGVAGRFIYVQIPRSIQGKELDAREMEALSENLVADLRSKYHLDDVSLRKLEDYNVSEKYKNLTFSSALVLLIKDYAGVKKLLKELRKSIREGGVSERERRGIIKAAKHKMILSRKIGMLKVMQRMFRYWHIIHLPFAITMFVIMLIHVAVTIAFGYKWIF